VEAFLRRGAAVVGLDRNPAVESLWARPEVLGLTCDLEDPDQVSSALDEAVKAFGGVDMLVLNAGVFPATQPIAEIGAAQWKSAMSVNVEANLTSCRHATRCSPSRRAAAASW